MNALNDRRVWLGGGALAALIIIAASWFLLISPELSSADDQRETAASTRAQNSVIEQKVKTLKAKSADVAKYTASLRDALEALPYDSGLPAFTRQLTKQAKAAGVRLSSISVGALAPVVTTPAPGTTTSADPAGAGSAPADGSSSDAPQAGTTASGAPAPGGSAAGGLYSVQLSLKTDGTYDQQLAFVKALQQTGPRVALVTSTQFAPGTGATDLVKSGTSTTQITVFSAPLSPEQVKAMDKLLQGDLGN